MRDTLKTFTTESLEKASGALLKKLGIKYTPLVEGIPFDDYFEQNDFSYQYVKEAQKAIEHIWHIGYVNDATFIGEAANENNKAGASSINIFACEIKSEEYFPRGLAADLTRAFNRVSTRNVNFNYDMPVVVIMRQGRLLSIATCERSERADGLGEKVGKVTILRNMDCENLHAGHRQILERIAKDVSGSSSYEELHKKWFASFSIDVLSDKFFEGYKAIYEDIIEYVTGKRMVENGNKWKEQDNGKPCKEIMSEFDAFPDPEKAVRDYVKNLMGRLVFIQFLQKKGWMGVPAGDCWEGGDPEFLQNLFKKSDKKETFIDDVLEPLFNDLNTKRHGDLVTNHNVSLNQNIKVPYLNGGLFELDKSDDTKFPLPAHFMKDLFDFFVSFNFTIDENAPDDVEIGVDPEMLGRIFENLLEDNKEKGTYYTPKEIVQYMCHESLIAYLTTRVIKKQGENHKPEHEIRNAVRKLLSEPESIVPKMRPDQLEDFGTYIREVKVCDPAIGSGAFPMGLLNELVRCRILIDAWAKDAYDHPLTGNLAALKAEIIRNNIYGVDIEKGAIDIARLRFWLSIIVDEKTPEALPNFDYKFMQGNSLIPTFAGQYINLSTKNQQHKYVQQMKEVKTKIYKFKQDFYSSSGVEKMKLNILIKDHILQLISLQLGYEIQSWAEAHAEQLSLDFGDSPKITVKEAINQLPEDRKRIVELGKSLREKLADKAISLEHRAQTDIQFFDWRMMFTEVFDKEDGGFDIVIGNPPYIKEYENKNAFDGFRETSPYYVGKMDIWHGFACMAMDMLSKNGILAFIAQNNWTTNDGAKLMRKKIVDDARILQMVDFNDYMIFGNSASIQTMIMIFSHDSISDNYPIDYRKLSANSSKLEMLKLLYGNGNHLFMTPVFNRDYYKGKFITFSLNDAFLNKISSQKERLKEDEVAQGIVFPQDFLNKKGQQKLGRFNVGDGIFGLSDAELRSLNLSDKEMTLIKPYYTTNQIHRYSTDEGNNELWMIYTSSEFKNPKSMDDFPAIKSHLDQFLPIFTSDNKPYGLHRARKESFFIGEKIMSLRKCVGHPCFSYSRCECYVTQTFFSIKTTRWDNKFLVGVLNSKLIEFWLRNRGKMQGENFQIDKEPLLQIPLPQTDCHQDSISVLVQRIISSQRPCHKTDFTAIEHEIDRQVYELYGLTNGEVKIIDPSEATVGLDDELFKA